MSKKIAALPKTSQWARLIKKVLISPYLTFYSKKRSSILAD